jgi:hypothetical protein
MKDKEIHNLLEVALTLKIPITAVVADVTVTYPNEADKKVTCTKIRAEIAMPPARAKELLLHEFGDEPGEVQVLRGDESLPDMVAEGAHALQKSLTNLLQAMGGEDYAEIVGDLKSQEDPQEPSSELETLVFTESILSDVLGLDPLGIDLASFIMQWGKLHDHLRGMSTRFEDPLNLAAGEPDGATAENLVYAFCLSRKTRAAQPAVDTGSSARAAACDFQAFMLRGLIDVLAYLSITTEVTGQYLGGSGSDE